MHVCLSDPCVSLRPHAGKQGCVYVCVYVFICIIYMHTDTYACMYVYIRTYIRMHIRVHKRCYTYIPTCIHMHMHTCLHMHIRVHERHCTSKISLHRVLGIEKRLLKHPRCDEESVDSVIVVLKHMYVCMYVCMCRQYTPMCVSRPLKHHRSDEESVDGVIV